MDWVSTGINTASTSLLGTSDGQDQRFRLAFSILEAAIADRAFPGASVAVTHDGRLIASKAFGHFAFESDLPGENFAVTPATSFDLASLTKVVATTTMAMLLYERGVIDLDVPVVGVIPEFVMGAVAGDRRRQDVTFRRLLAHSSGLPAYEKLFLKHTAR